MFLPLKPARILPVHCCHPRGVIFRGILGYQSSLKLESFVKPVMELRGLGNPKECHDQPLGFQVFETALVIHNLYLDLVPEHAGHPNWYSDFSGRLVTRQTMGLGGHIAQMWHEIASFHTHLNHAWGRWDLGRFKRPLWVVYTSHSYS